MLRNRLIASVITATILFSTMGSVSTAAYTEDGVWSRDNISTAGTNGIESTTSSYLSANKTKEKHEIFFEEEYDDVFEVIGIDENGATYESVLNEHPNKTETRVLKDVPIYKQEKNSNYCWAECIRAIFNYNMDKEYTTDNIIRAVKVMTKSDPDVCVTRNGTASDYTMLKLMQKYMPTYGYSPEEYKRPLTDDEIVKSITADMPAIIMLQNRSRTIGHTVILVGYKADAVYNKKKQRYDYNVTDIYVIDPETGKRLRYDYPNLGDEFAIITDEGAKLRWTKTIVL